jgi:DNA polymerase-3 subunit delta'
LGTNPVFDKKMRWHTIGFEKIKDFFEKAAKTGTLAHAYLFSGQEMIGKKTFALELIGLVNGNSGTDSGSETIINADLLLIDASSSESGQVIAIEEIRRARSFVSLSPIVGPYKFVVINDAHLMTTEAQNALLKVLEEPNSSSILILVTANPNALLPTIISRCQEIRFPPPQADVIRKFLDNSDLSKSEAEFLTEFSNGRVGLIKTVLREKSFSLIKGSVEDLIGLIKANINKRLAVAQELADEKNKEDLMRKVLYWILYMRIRISEPKAPKILRGLLELHKVISQPQFNHRLALENFLVQL